MTMRLWKKMALVALLLGSYAIGMARPINSVKSVREDVDGAYIGANQVRVKAYGNSSFLARASFRMPVGVYDINALVAYDGKPSLGVGVLGDRIGVEATLAEGKKSASLEGCVGGFMGRGSVTSTKDGLSEDIRVSRAESFGPTTLQLGVSGNRDAKNNYGIKGDFYGEVVVKTGKMKLVPNVGASLDKKLSEKASEYKYAGSIGLIVVPKDSRASIGLGLGNSGNLLDLNKYNPSFEIRYDIK